VYVAAASFLSHTAYFYLYSFRAFDEGTTSVSLLIFYSC